MGFFDLFKSDDSNDSSSSSNERTSERSSNHDSTKDDDINMDDVIQSSIFNSAAID